MLKERLAEELTTTLNAFQDMQRLACQKERDEMNKARETWTYPGVRIPPPPANNNRGSNNGTNDFILFFFCKLVSLVVAGLVELLLLEWR